MNKLLSNSAIYSQKFRFGKCFLMVLVIKELIFKNLKPKKLILLINFIFAQTYFLVASSQIFKNDAILINHGSFF